MRKHTPHRRVIVLVIVLIILLTIVAWPLPAALRRGSGQSVTMTDRYGSVLYESRAGLDGLTQSIAFQDIPERIVDALVAIEDKEFFTHHGISLRGIARALLSNVRAGSVVSGGSTITQQMIRNAVHPTQRTLLYKCYEALMAIKAERVMSKQQILAQYLSTAYFGHQAYGLKAAAQTYFGKSVGELSLAESALLIGLLQSPSSLDPFTNMTRAKARQMLVLQAVRNVGAASDDALTTARKERLTLTQDTVRMKAPHFVQWLLADRLADIAGKRTVRTTLDLPLQQEIERVMTDQLQKLKDKNVTSAAVVVLDARSGDLLAMVGSHDYDDVLHDGAVNRALALRQPGSAIKPFTYALALEQGATAATTVADIETQFFTQEGNPYIPRNYDYGYHGLVRYREALANSYNIAAVKVLQSVGVDHLLTFLRSIGVGNLTQTAEHYGLALTLGDSEVRLLDLARAYAMFPRGGQTLSVRTLLTDPPTDTRQVLSAQTAWLISDILSDSEARLPEFGQAEALTFSFPVAAKTGTTRNSRDNWTVGYTPQRVVGVWVGNADNTPMKNTSGITGAAPIFHDAMLAAMRNLPYESFARPADIRTVTICRLSGQLPTPLCPQTIEESFRAGTEPKQSDTIFQDRMIDTRNGLMADGSCDTQFVAHRTYAIFPPQLRKWARENGWAVAPDQASPLCGAQQQEAHVDLSITKPHDRDSFRLDPLIPDDRESIVLEASAPMGTQSVTWLVDGAVVGEGTGPDFRLTWKPSIGNHLVTAITDTQRDSVRMTIE